MPRIPTGLLDKKPHSSPIIASVSRNSRKTRKHMATQHILSFNRELLPVLIRLESIQRAILLPAFFIVLICNVLVEGSSSCTVVNILYHQ